VKVWIFKGEVFEQPEAVVPVEAPETAAPAQEPAA
jgi:ribosomal protein S3